MPEMSMAPAELLMRLGGSAHDFPQELHEAISLTADEVLRTGESGTVTVTIKVSKAKNTDTVVIIEDAIKRTPPKEAGGGMMAFVNGGRFYRNDPRQEELPLRVIRDETTGELREVPDDASVRKVD